jgi:hypothetical protein
MDETGVLLSVLNSLKVLVSKDDFRKHRGATVKRTLVTSAECISADGRPLHPLTIWPAAAHRSSGTIAPPPDGILPAPKQAIRTQKSSLYWVQHVFDPQTRDRAGGRTKLGA